ncbi:MAG: toprim domain-containing protein [Afipia sp.]
MICEGFATGLRIYQAIRRDCRVIVAFNAGNLLKVAESLPKGGMAVIAADNDHETQEKIGINPGMEKAREAAEMLGIGVAYPECGGSDWDDYAQERREEIMERECLKSSPASGSVIAEKINAEIAIAIKRQARRLR